MLFNDLVLIFVLAGLSCGVDVFLSLYFTSFFSLWGFVLFFFKGPHNSSFLLLFY